MLRRLTDFLSAHLPIELHLVDWSTLKRHNWTGPGTNVYKRLLRNDPGITKLDEAAKQHDIEYTKSTDSEHRRRADIALYHAAKEIFTDKSTPFGDKINSWIVKRVMKAQAGLGIVARGRRRSLEDILRGAGMKRTITQTAKKKKRKNKKKKNTNEKKKNSSGRVKSRIIPFPKSNQQQQGGFIPALVAILAGLASGAAAVSTAISKNKQLVEMKRHNQLLEGSLLKGKGVLGQKRKHSSKN